MKIKTLWIVLAAVVVLLLIFGGCTVGKYNTLVADSNEVENAWGKVQTAYQRRRPCAKLGEHGEGRRCP